MPEMDGFEVCSCLKKDPITKNIPVIFLSALKEEFDIVKGFNVGGVDFVTKPFKSEILLSRMRAHLTIDKLRKQLAHINTDLEQQIRERTQKLNHPCQTFWICSTTNRRNKSAPLSAFISENTRKQYPAYPVPGSKISSILSSNRAAIWRKT